MMSSIHEILFIRENIRDVDFCLNMVREINHDIVSDEIQLSNNIYLYNLEEQKFTIYN